VINYDSICKKLGFDPLKDRVVLPNATHEDDRAESPFAKLTAEELDVLGEHLLNNADKLKDYIVN
jgi:hypothetical protein